MTMMRSVLLVSALLIAQSLQLPTVKREDIPQELGDLQLCGRFWDIIVKFYELGEVGKLSWGV